MTEPRIHFAGTFEEECGCVIERKWLHAVLAFPAYAERNAARRQQPHAGKGRQARNRRSRLDEMLEVVEDEQQPTVPEPLVEVVRALECERVRDRREDEVVIAEGREVDEEDAVRKVVDEPAGDLDRESRLARRHRTSQRHQRSRANELDQFRKLSPPADERRFERRQVRVRRRLLRRTNVSLSSSQEAPPRAVSAARPRGRTTEMVRWRRQRGTSRIDDAPGLDLEVEREAADRGDTDALADRELDRLPGPQPETGNAVETHLPPRGLDGCAGRRPLLS